MIKTITKEREANSPTYGLGEFDFLAFLGNNANHTVTVVVHDDRVNTRKELAEVLLQLVNVL